MLLGKAIASAAQGHFLVESTLLPCSVGFFPVKSKDADATLRASKAP